MTSNKIYENEFLIEQKQKELENVAWRMVHKEGGIVLEFNSVDEGKELIEVSKEFESLIRYISSPNTKSKRTKGLQEIKRKLLSKWNELGGWNNPSMYVEDAVICTTLRGENYEEQNESIYINNELFADLQIKAQKIIYRLLSENPEILNSYNLFKNYLWKSLENKVFDLGRELKRKSYTLGKEKILRENSEAEDIEDKVENYDRQTTFITSYDNNTKLDKNFESDDTQDPQNKYYVAKSIVNFSEALDNIDLNLSEKNCIEALKNSNNPVEIKQYYKTEINSIRKKIYGHIK